jgi:hypothetical protein
MYLLRILFVVEGGFKENHAHGTFVQFGFRATPVQGVYEYRLEGE